MLSSDKPNPQVSRSLEYRVRVGLMLVNMDPIKLTALFTSIWFIHEMMMLPNFPCLFFFLRDGQGNLGNRPKAPEAQISFDRLETR